MCPRLKEECSVTCKCIATNNQVEVMHLLISKKKVPLNYRVLALITFTGYILFHWVVQ